ncbi:MAG: metalloregulator ArsR/SmtB family transcription factor [Gemmatimonadetes bacterium]|nr:metalloregulator ArsR/SmtB family transcription factor [Gemmatimonadota bacterium]MCY3613393.1 metalloregulator ArsR/SmtB family transcription factor [Gemmatimonadota bacterium]MCY3678168.1 metalloregulator ArsR/SmtB family transcription factor [Gemmatimonadota bacterium]MYA43734.1 helix-turn-helix transcriptional regulator [Gemmatimonadota bacterium]MYE95148.1 helix-turn-helix transcriptional regulator [Gemmatimonadota bacterium]
MPDVFAAVSDPTRRLILGRLREEGESSLKTLARCLPMSRQAVTKHLDILVAAGLVTKRAQGRNRLHALRPEPLREVEDWLAPYAAAWDERLEHLRFHLHGED